jgi:hypothetical protein
MCLLDTTKDTIKARNDLVVLCNHPTLELHETSGKPHASFYLKPQQRKEVLQWIKGLKFPDGLLPGNPVEYNG